MATDGVSGSTVSGIGPIGIGGMDLETALMAVQSQRAQLLESQLADQIKEVQNRNNKVAALNGVLNELNKALASLKGNGDKSGDKVKDEWVSEQESTPSFETALTGAGLTLVGLDLPSALKDISKGKLDAAINKLKGDIDALNNSQQMDMLRLQSLTNKRNEAFDVMSNFIKKMQDSRSSIIGNMR